MWTERHEIQRAGRNTWKYRPSFVRQVQYNNAESKSSICSIENK